MRRLRGLLYRLGVRPKLGSIFYSPSASMVYGFRDAIRKATDR